MISKMRIKNFKAIIYQDKNGSGDSVITIMREVAKTELDL